MHVSSRKIRRVCDRTCSLQLDKTALSSLSVHFFLLLTPITPYGQLLPFTTEHSLIAFP